MTLTELEDRLTEWHRKKYNRTDIDLLRTAAKAGEEVGEVLKATLKGDTENLKE